MAAAEQERRSPYQGLIPYGERDAPYFFGRERETRLISANLFASSLTLLYGASGVGKSSVLRAGVAHQLRQREDLLLVVFNTWQSEPVAGLKAALAEAAKRAGIETLPDDTKDAPLADYLAAVAAATGRRLLLILDQFEEYFLYRRDGDRFSAEFPAAVKQKQSPVSFLISIREDSVAKLDYFEGSIPNLFNNYLRVEHLDGKAARAAIEKPVERYNAQLPEGAHAVEIEPSLVEAVLRQVETGRVVLGEAGRGVLAKDDAAKTRIETPYLQLVLTRLWNEEMRKGSHVLRLSTLEALGGAERIVRTHLDETMGALPPAEQRVAASVFHYLVTPSGTKIAHTTRDLSEYAELPPARLEPVLEKLSSGGIRILRPIDPPPDQPGAYRYEIFHDVLAAAILDWRARYTLERLRARGRRKRRIAVGVVASVAAVVVGAGLWVHYQRLAEAEKDRWTLQQAEQEAEEEKERAVEELGSYLIYQKTIALMQDLAREDSQDKEAAVENLKRLAEEGRLPASLVPAIKELVQKNAPSEAKELSESLRKAEIISATGPAGDDPAELVPIIFIQIIDEAARDNARQLEGQLEKNGFSVPGIERAKRGPKVKELRYFRKADEQEAVKIVGLLDGAGWPGVQARYVPGYERTKVIRPRQYELWYEDMRNPVTDESDKKDEPQTQATPETQADEGKSHIIAATFPEEQKDEANNLVYQLRRSGFADARAEAWANYPRPGQNKWRVVLGPYPNEDARRMLEKVRAVAPGAALRSAAKPQ